MAWASFKVHGKHLYQPEESWHFPEPAESRTNTFFRPSSLRYFDVTCPPQNAHFCGTARRYYRRGRRSFRCYPHCTLHDAANSANSQYIFKHAVIDAYCRLLRPVPRKELSFFLASKIHSTVQRGGLRNSDDVFQTADHHRLRIGKA